MKRTGRRIRNGILIALGVALIGGVVYFNSLLPIITGYAAKNLGSAVFISGRDQADVEAVDLNFSFIKYAKNTVNYEDKSVTSRFLWHKSKAIYREGFGVTLLRDVNEKDLRKIRFPRVQPGYGQDTIKWPLGDIIPDTTTGINLKALEEIKDKVINKNAYKGNIFAFLVLHKGIPVMEAYKPKFNYKTRFISWSMAKSFTNAMIGILVKEGKIDINQPVGFPEWKNDDRNKITLNDLLHMQSGLRWNEDYGTRSDVTVMLHCERDMGRFAWNQPLQYPVGSHWYYSSGTTNIVTNLIREKLGNDSLYYTFAERELFNKIGMPDAVLEVDPTGAFVGSSYLYATARDYARFGLLYMNDGVFNGERILPDGWVRYSTTAAENSDGKYGAFFWLNKNKGIPAAPADMVRCDGHDGQHIFIIPSHQLIVVILGYSPKFKGGIDLERLITDIMGTV
jgi:CubicO group peptidase (beta-lactamase class C family)